MAYIFQNGGGSSLPTGNLQTANAISGTLQRVTDPQGNQSAISLSETELNLNKQTLSNFTPTYQTGGDITIDATNNESLNCSVYGLTSANSVTFDNLFDGFSMSFISIDANVTTFSVGGGYTLANRQGHTQTAGQYAMVSVFFHNNVLFLGGDTQ